MPSCRSHKKLKQAWNGKIKTDLESWKYWLLRKPKSPKSKAYLPTLIQPKPDNSKTWKHDEYEQTEKGQSLRHQISYLISWKVKGYGGKSLTT